MNGELVFTVNGATAVAATPSPGGIAQLSDELAYIVLSLKGSHYY